MFDKVQKGRLLTNLEKERGAAQSASSAVQRLYHVQLDLRRIFLTHDSCCHFRSGDTKVSPTCSTLLYPEIEVQRGTGKCGKNALTFFNTAFICIQLHSSAFICIPIIPRFWIQSTRARLSTMLRFCRPAATSKVFLAEPSSVSTTPLDAFFSATHNPTCSYIFFLRRPCVQHFNSLSLSPSLSICVITFNWCVFLSDLKASLSL